MGLQGFYKVAVIDKNGKEVWSQPDWEKNLILNQGLDAVAANALSSLSLNGIAGVGTRTNTIDSGDSIGSAINGEVFLTPVTGLQNFSSSIVNDWTGSLWSGDLIKFADGTTVMVTGSRPASVIRGDFSASINSSATIASQSFTIWKTGATGLHREVKRAGSNIATSSYLNGGCGTTISIPSGSVLHYRTYDFGSESINRTYTEIGVGWSYIGWSSSSFSRVLLPVPVPALVDQRLRLIYGLLVTFSPTASVYTANAPIVGWPVAPATNTNISQSIQLFQGGNPGCLSYVDSGGGAQAPYISLEPPGGGYIFGSSNSQSLTPMGSTPRDRNQNVAYHGASTLPYVQGTYEMYRYTTFTLNELNTSSIASFGFGNQYISFGIDYHPWYANCAFAMVFDQNQTKYNTQTLTMYFKWNWDRVLA